MNNQIEITDEQMTIDFPLKPSAKAIDNLRKICEANGMVFIKSRLHEEDEVGIVHLDNNDWPLLEKK